MTHWKSIFLAAALAAPMGASAQQARTVSFGAAPPSDFLVQQIGSLSERPTGVEIDMIAAMNGVVAPSKTSDPAGKIEPEPAVAPAAAPAFEPSRIFRVAPQWLKSGRGVFASFGQPFIGPAVPIAMPATFEVGNCQVPYRPTGFLPADTEMRRARYYPLMAVAACEAGVPVRLFDAMIIQESRYNPFAISRAGAMGLTQLMPGTARQLGVMNPFDAAANLRGGARYLASHLGKFGDPTLALAAYNAGPGRIEQYGGIPPFAETRNYVREIARNVTALVSGPRPPIIQLASATPAPLAANLSFARKASILKFTE
ncbi:Lytic transglycosylase, catalytic [Sphingomonas sp. SKA58]|jgi:soluble lytic murein transglycosylase-like protein|uniref:lytic transglycosylase domain-containing protein n=1 Tax=Sphingomonas sp. (strain SKA58) TaxID=314266 RepID=UPI0000D7AA86|nr:lytic transglycosylase domain-containing protein [Sphingomonas sp. SKA58]EAT07418.1 Lytic transglycosylase, catalytic [Sphingomonas sp. SKA58]